MPFPGIRSNNWWAGALGVNVAWALFFEFNGAPYTPIAQIFYPSILGRYDAGVVPGMNDRGNRQYLRWKTAYDTQKPDYSKYFKTD